jgi:hypothetical protein
MRTVLIAMMVAQSQFAQGEQVSVGGRQNIVL